MTVCRGTGALSDVSLQKLRIHSGDDDTFTQHHNKFCGMTFELPLLLVERVLGLKDIRSIFSATLPYRQNSLGHCFQTLPIASALPSSTPR